MTMKIVRLNNREKYAKVLDLVNKGVQQKQIAVEVGITEKTVTRWLRDWKAQQRKDTKLLAKLYDRLQATIANPNSKPSEIKELVQVYNMLK